MNLNTIITKFAKPFFKCIKTNKFSGSPAPGSHKWTDIIDDIVWDGVFDALDEKARLVNSGLYTEYEYHELCDFTGKFSCDYKNRYVWCCSHWVIEYRGRSQWSHWFEDSPVDDILVVYGPNGNLNIKGYKDKKHVLEDHIHCDNYDEFYNQVIDKYKVLEKNPDFIGRRKDDLGENRIAQGNGVTGEAYWWILEDEPVVPTLK